MAGSSIIAEKNNTLRTKCANLECGKEITTETRRYDPAVKNEWWVWGLVEVTNGKKKICPTCNVCYESGWRPPNYEGIE